MTECYIIVKQYTKQEHQSPTEFVTELPMEQDIYTDKHGDCTKYSIYFDIDEVREECSRLNQSNPWRKFTYVKGICK